jgi:hypothetical protein
MEARASQRGLARGQVHVKTTLLWPNNALVAVTQTLYDSDSTSHDFLCARSDRYTTPCATEPAIELLAAITS